VPGEVAVDYFLNLPGIPGESADAKHKDEIDVVGFGFGASMGKKPGIVAGLAALDELMVLAPTSKASPLLWLACASGQHLQTAVLTCRRTAVKTQVNFLKITLTDVTITSYEVEADDDEPPLDQITLGYWKIELVYTPVDSSGKPQAPVRADWHVNKIPKF
jgi:type VI secretion system secreted protein Hcp